MFWSLCLRQLLLSCQTGQSSLLPMISQVILDNGSGPCVQIALENVSHIPVLPTNRLQGLYIMLHRVDIICLYRSQYIS